MYMYICTHTYTFCWFCFSGEAWLIQRELEPPTEQNYAFLKKLFIYLFIYLWLCWVFVSARGLSLVAASGGHSSSRCAGLSLSRSLLLRSTGSRRAGSVVVAHGLSCSAACGNLPLTRARTRVPCISRQTLNHRTTREAPELRLFNLGFPLFWAF